MVALPRRLAMSSHLSFFHRRDVVYLYHDVWGYLLEMSADLVAFVRAFGDGVAVAPALAQSSFAFAQAHDFAEVLAAHHVLISPGTDALDDLLDAYPVKARWRVAYHNDDGSIDVVQGRHLRADRRLIRLRGVDAALWRAIDGEHTCRELAARLQHATELAEPLDAPLTRLDEPSETGAGLERWICKRIATWTHSARQWTRVSTTPMAQWRGRPPPYLTSTMPYRRLTDAGVHDAHTEEPDSPVVQTAAYHRDTVQNANAQFDDVETTLSHLFRDPHVSLHGRSWAAAIRHALVTRGLWRKDTNAVVEVGGGLGWFALRMLEDCSTAARQGLTYRVLDIAPALQAAQRARLQHLPEVSCLTCDAETLTLPDASVDLLLCNEVIADLRTAWLTRDDVQAARAEPRQSHPVIELKNPGLAAVLRYDLAVDAAPDRFAINLGAMHMIERIAHVLRPGGAALLTEFGHRLAYPVESTQLDHPEFSIQFSHLAQVARRCGLRAEIVSVPELVSLDGSATALRSTQTWWANLRFLAADHGVQLAKRAWTEPMLRERCGDALPLERLEALYWQPIGERTMGLVPDEFLALILRKPLTTGTEEE